MAKPSGKGRRKIPRHKVKRGSRRNKIRDVDNLTNGSSKESWNKPPKSSDLEQAMPRKLEALLNIRDGTKQKKNFDKSSSNGKSVEYKLDSRKQSESVNQFVKRVSTETLHNQREAIREAKRIKQSKKKYLKRKNLAEKEKLLERILDEEDEDKLSKVERIEFGDVVDRPPDISVRPKARN